MKLYKFYYKANKNDIIHDVDEKRHKKSQDEYIMDKYPLYAFTIDKKVYKEFKNERNMDSFIIIKSDIDKEDYPDYAESHRDALLDIISLKVKDENGSPYEMEFAVTQYEQIVLDDFDFEYALGDKSYFIPYLIFNKEIIKALKVLEYPFFYNLMTGSPIEEDDEYYTTDVSNNDFEILYSQFSGTF